MTDEQEDLVFELQELQTEVEENSKTLDNFCNILERNNEKLRKLKQMNHRTPYKPEVQYYDEQMVIVNGVSYTRKEPTPIIIQEDENTIVIAGVKYQKIEDPKPQTLYDALGLPYFTNGYMFNKQQKEWICKVVSEWLPNDDPHDGEEFQLGWNACLNYLRENMK
jgi:hypothetical protein